MSGSNLVARFGASVRNLRYRLGISQETLAERADLHRTYIAGIESGARNVTLKSIDKLARALEVSTGTLLSQSSGPGLRTGNTHPESSTREFVDILLAEDNPDDVEMTLQAFKRARLANSILVVSDGAEALDYVFCRGIYARRRREQRPKMLLLDLNLPKVSGLEVLRRIKADKRTKMIPVVILTVSQKDRDIAECRRLGAESYIVKPMDFQRLSAVTPELSLNWGLFKSPAPLRD